ncbi:chloride channel protein [Actinomadura sp. RB99]|uniref:chloride channel protein n=1 Tax=Actinomadura sp. RB99 TaxID=2691577 RepID=UPI001684559E
MPAVRPSPSMPLDAVGVDGPERPPGSGERARVARPWWREPVHSWPYLPKWLLVGAVIGAVAGLGALALHESLALVTDGVLGRLAGFSPATVAGDGHAAPASGIARPWAVPALVAGGAVFGAVVVRRLAPEAGGAGTDAAIKAIHHEPLRMRGRVPVVKLVASALTLGSGGSGGTEGPAAQISAAFGSVSARTFGLGAADARVAATASLAAGVGAIFKAPFGGVVLGMELLYRRGVAPEMLVPGLIATAVAYGEFAAVRGFGPMFGHQAADPTTLAQVPFLLGLGMLVGLVARCYCWSLRNAKALFDAQSRIPWPVKPAVGGLAVGALGLLLPEILGTGYGVAQSTLDAGWLLGAPLWILLALPAAKIVGTALTVGSGGTAGTFGPAIVIGAAAGAACWRLAEMSGAPVEGPEAFVVAGMAACLGSAAHVPLTAVITAAEVTGTLDHLIPTMISVTAASVVMGERTLFPSQLPEPGRRLEGVGGQVVEVGGYRVL